MPILSLIQEYHERSGGHCGLTVPKITRRSGKNSKAVRAELKELHRNGQISIRDGAQGAIIFPSNK